MFYSKPCNSSGAAFLSFLLLQSNKNGNYGNAFQHSPLYRISTNQKLPLHPSHSTLGQSSDDGCFLLGLSEDKRLNQSILAGGRSEISTKIVLFASPRRRNRDTPTATAISSPEAPGTTSSSASSPGASSPLTSSSFTGTSSSSNTSAQTSSPQPPLESILDDGKGHINPELATAIYQWEMAHNNASDSQNLNNKHQGFSTRDGLRLVDELAREVMDSFVESSSQKQQGFITISYSDLVQEGMIALLRAMTSYDNYVQSKSNDASTSDDVLPFQAYSKNLIKTTLLSFLSTSSSLTPVPLPPTLLETALTTLRAADEAADRLRGRLGREPSLGMVCEELNEWMEWHDQKGVPKRVTMEQLALYKKLYKTLKLRGRGEAMVSVEDGLEVFGPSSSDQGDQVGGSTTAQSSDSGTRSVAGEGAAELLQILSAPTQDLGDVLPTTEAESHDDWITPQPPPERTARNALSSLSSSLPFDPSIPRDENYDYNDLDILSDQEEINNPTSYIHHFLLNESLQQFLQSTLSPLELLVIQLRFGMEESKYGGKGWSASDIGRRLGMSKEEVARVASEALEKLRMKASGSLENNVISKGDNPMPYWEDDDPYVEVSL